jgi:DNA polymerase-3 subunit delta'
MVFSEVRGHEKTKAVLLRTMKRRRLPPAMLFSGPDGVGKKTLALLTARGYLCERGPGEPCDACSACGRIRRGVHPDVRVVAPDGTAIKVERVRELVRDINAVPFEARARFFIVDEAHSLTEEASNALLKGLEEPPRRSHVVLITASPMSLLPTIRSRCQTLRFATLPPSDIREHMERELGMPADEARLRAQLGNGSIGAAIALESESYREMRVLLLELLARITDMPAIERLERAQRLSEEENAETALTTMRSLLRDIAVIRQGGGVSLLNADAEASLRGIAQGRIGGRAIQYAERIGDLRSTLRGNANRLMVMDLLIQTLAGEEGLHLLDPS